MWYCFTIIRKDGITCNIFLNFKHDTLSGECVSDFQPAIQHIGYDVRNQVLVLMGSVLFSWLTPVGVATLHICTQFFNLLTSKYIPVSLICSVTAIVSVSGVCKHVIYSHIYSLQHSQPVSEITTSMWSTVSTLNTAF